VVQVASTLKIVPRNVKIRVTGQWSRSGSVLQGDAASVCEGITTEISLDCEESTERIAQLIKMAEATCFTLATLRHPVEAHLVATVNGEPFPEASS
jgi:hypothetical protein